jgi:RNA polymerase sigma factor (sigma-70 family)
MQDMTQLTRWYGVFTYEDPLDGQMEVSALKYSGGIGLHARSPLLRLQSDERLVALVRRGNPMAFETLVSRYESRLLAFCRHMLGSREDAEDVLQEVLAAAFNAMIADDRPINVRPWLYRIARNRSLNHLRRIQAVGVDSMDVHFSDNGASTADKVHEREEFRLLVGDISELPETQKTALVLREMDALSYEQIAEAMETTVPSVKSLLVRARISLAEASEARLLSCDEVRLELGEVAEGLRRRPSPLVRRHLGGCKRCSTFRVQLKETNKALAAFLPIGPLVFLKKLAFTHLGHSAGSSATGAGAAGSTAAAGSTIMAGSGAGGFVSAGLGAIATKAAAGLAAAAIVAAGAVEVDHSGRSHAHKHATESLRAAIAVAPAVHHHAATWAGPNRGLDVRAKRVVRTKPAVHKPTPLAAVAVKPAIKAAIKPVAKPAVTTPAAPTPAPTPPAPPPGRTQTQTDPTVLSPTQTTPSTTPTSAAATATTPPPTAAPVIPPDTTTTTATADAPTIPPPPSGTGSSPPDASSGAGGSSSAGGAGDPDSPGSTSPGGTSGAGTAPAP